jgi:phosphatidylglycerophosphatase C
VTRTVAAFDFDGTLTRRDSLVPFLTSYLGRAHVARLIAAESPRLALMAVGRADRDLTKERFLGRALTGHAYDDVRAAGKTFAATVVRSGISDQMRDRIAWHRGEGHEIVIVSASLDVYLLDVASDLEIEHVLCTSLEVDETGRCTGRLLGGNCRGPEKAKRLRAHLGDADAVLWAYGDSAGDTEMLAMAQHPVRVRKGQLK